MIPEWEPLVRGGLSLGVLLIMIAWETLAPRRVRVRPRLGRWLTNGGMALFGALLIRFVIGVPAIAVSVWATQQNLGLLNLIDLGLVPAVVVTVILMDLVVYWQHRIFHMVPWLWRVHRAHHTDLDLDATSAFRFHPVEITISAGTKALAAGLLGAPVIGIILFEGLLNGMAIFNHANARIGPRTDGFLRWLIVTPDMHRIHHSIDGKEMRHNFGFQLSLWDRVFGSYLAEAKAGQEKLPLGVAHFDQPQDNRLDRLMLQPLRNPR